VDQRECGDFIQRRRCSAMKKAPSKRGLRRQCGELIGTPYPAPRTVRRHLSAGPTLNAVPPHRAGTTYARAGVV
jgi:hypothetical protein